MQIADDHANRPRSRIHFHLVGRILFVLIAIGFVSPEPAYGYVDPVSGSIIIQVVAAALLAGGIALKRSWLKVSSTMRGVWERVRAR